jgi:alkanesulfonate monooxygenase SsuD/methylene tetrahydromethanopterin reductase-like flavin-dependent oxidoreductase (luciferase family)
LKPLVIPQKPLAQYVEDLEQFGQLRGEPAHPLVALSIYCSESEEEGRNGGAKYFTEYADAAIRAYELTSQHFATTRGYEGYAQRADPARDRATLAREMGVMWLENHISGTPEMCISQLRSVSAMLHPAEIIVLPRVGDMPVDAAIKSIRLFAEAVLPAVHEIEVAVSP